MSSAPVDDGSADHRQARPRRRGVQLAQRHRRRGAEIMRTGCAPEGRFVRSARPSDELVAFAGGSGITPIMSLVRTALATIRPPRAVVLRQPRPRFGHLRRRARPGSPTSTVTGFGVQHHFDDDRGVVTRRRRSRRSSRESVDGADYYVCGPGTVHGHRRGDAARRRCAARRGCTSSASPCAGPRRRRRRRPR